MLTMDKMDVFEKEEIDDSLYSRQRYVLGDRAMKRMAHSHVLIVGFGGLGVEIAKNVALAGVKILTIQDHRTSHISDLGTQYFIRMDDVLAKRSRIDAGISRMSQLNPHVCVKGSKDKFEAINGSWDFLSEYQCVVLTEVDIQTQLEVDDFCRNHSPPIAFVSGEVIGLFGQAFCDFGPQFEVFDKNGEEAKEVFICNITKDNPSVVTVFDARPHGFETGDVVKFKEVSGMVELNGQTRKITVISPYQFTMENDSSYSEYTGGGIVCEVKQPTITSFNSLEQELMEPSLSTPDFAKFSAPGVIHVAMMTYLQGQEKEKHQQESWEDFLSRVKQVNQTLKSPVELDDDILQVFYLTRLGCFAPLCALFGGFLAQEVLKALSGKFTPLKQWLHMDACEVLDKKQLDSALHQLRGDRYDQLRACVGQKCIEKLSSLKLFMIGCGAIGCEMMKLYALLGIGRHGKLTITDNDLIEKSNLNRQFLFHAEHVQKPKSVTAANSALEMNPELQIEAQEYKVFEGTETHIHTDAFFSSQDVIVNALDNVEARVYIDQRCVNTMRPLLESGTTGAKGHTQVIVPNMTESYGSQRDPVDEDVPFCSLKSFPAKLDHCIIWARNKFATEYHEKPCLFNKFWADHGSPGAVEQRLASGDSVDKAWLIAKLLRNRPLNWKECVFIARHKFEKFFNHKAKELLHAYPLDHLRDNGTPFWQLPRRPPHPIEFNFKLSSHKEFIVSTARLYACSTGISVTDENLSVESIETLLQECSVPPFVPKSKRIIVDEEESPGQDEISKDMEDDEVIANTLRQCLAHPNVDTYFREMVPQTFEKDDDTNGHIDFIVATANLRAEMYGIAVSDRYDIKRVAGKIIPAIATTTATVAGLVCIELFKLIRNASLEDYKNCFLSLALPALVLSEPGQAKIIKVKEGLTFTLWDKIQVQATDGMTMNDFITETKKQVDLDVDMVLQGSKIIYSGFLPAHKKKINQSMASLVKRQGDKPYVDLTVCFSGVPEDVLESMPPVRMYLPS